MLIMLKHVSGTYAFQTMRATLSGGQAWPSVMSLETSSCSFPPGMVRDRG